MIYAVVGGYVAAFAIIAALVYALIKSKEREGEAIAGRVEAGGRAEQYRQALDVAVRNGNSWRIRNAALKKELDEDVRWIPSTVRDARARLFEEWARSEDAAAGTAGAGGDGTGGVPPAEAGAKE